MKATHLLKYSAIFLGTLVVITKPVLAHDLYSETGERWGQGAALERKGEFDSAIIQYKQALQAIKNINNQHLRDCATTGTVARLEGAKVGKQYIDTHGHIAILNDS